METMPSSKAAVRVEAAALSAVNFALQQNGVAAIPSVTVYNDSPQPLQDVTLQITSGANLCLPYSQHFDTIPANACINAGAAELVLDAQRLATLTESYAEALRLCLTHQGQTLYEAELPITVLAYDQWHGYASHPELLAAFVTPNHPALAPILTEAAQLLGQWSGDPSLDGYQTQDPNRVLKQAAAIYAALAQRDIVYCVPPASFEETGQRVRLCDGILQQRLATCLDISLLYAACLEAVGLHALLVLKPGHIFCGLWLEELTFPESIQDDVSLLTKRLASGINEIAVVECTAMLSGKNMTFDQAQAAAREQLHGTDAIEFVLDISRARLSGVKPLPVRIATESGWEFLRQQPSPAQAKPQAPDALQAATEVGDGREQLGKLQLWERKLLDLGLRNSLINMRLRGSLVPLIAPSLDELENALHSGSDFSVLPRPEDMAQQPQPDFETMHQFSSAKELLSSEFAAKRLRSSYDSAALNKAMKELYRSGKSSLEENGANTLYMALGVLRWYESGRSTKARYAPLVLLPIEMVRRSAAAGYTIRARDEDAQMNITMLEKLKQDFGIVISGLDPLPEDGRGVDVRAVFNTVRKAIMAQSRWDVLESAYLGIFSFSQFVMWNDLRNRTGDLMRNKIVRSLMEGKLSWDAQPMTIPDKVTDQGAFLPMAADASQLFAIGKAAQGESFVLHGPPGTGKSQTITTLIANALAQGKSVLFVAEKMAALEVVQKRLSKIGLGDFCLELHSNKAKKRYVLDQLRRSTEVTAGVSSQAYAARAEQLTQLRRELDGYAQALHTPNSAGITLYQAAGLYQENAQAPDIAQFSGDYVKNLTAGALKENQLLLEQLRSAGQALGHPCGHALAAVGATAYSQHQRYGLTPGLDSYRSAIHALSPETDALSALTGLPCRSRQELLALSQAALCLRDWQSLPRAWSAEFDPNMLLTDTAAMARHYIAAQDISGALLKQWKPEFLELDGEQLLQQWEETQGKWFLGKALGEKKLLKKLNRCALTPANAETAPQALSQLKEYRRERSAAEALLGRCGSALGPLYRGEETDYQAVLAATEKAQSLLPKLSAQNRSRIASDPAQDAAVNRFAAAWEGFAEAQNTLYDLLDIRSPSEADYLQSELALCARLDMGRDSLKDAIAFNATAQQASAAGLGNVVEAYRQGLAHEQLLLAYRKAIAQAMAIERIDSSEALAMFSGVVFNEKIRQLQRLDEEMMKLAQEEIFCRLAAQVPDFTREAAHSSELGILQRAIRSGGRGVSIRKLLTQIPNLLPRLCPCMLMSPISAAQYLEPDRVPFDTVVFDEASQLPTAKAVGALARGENAVIVGDPKQMPPTAFFVSNQLDEENLENEDLESILDDCLALNLPQTHLLWHYRSRHESLIAFSNAKFYENKLYTFPSVNDRISKVSLRHVDGVFQRSRSRQNRAEAEAVVAELKRRCHSEAESKLSVGVVTFNINQQNLIDDLLAEACREDPQLDAWAYQAEEPVFIKNLENVQGDERDVILFSVGYGPDEQGKVYMNFGPLNRDGGWRRLNVAITRARQEMVVFATLRPEQIDLSRTSAQGVEALKAFLEYAQSGKLPLEAAAISAKEAQTSGIADAICAFLEENGYETRRQVGHSQYRIDIGVADPKNQDRYCLGILLDGSAYAQSRTTRDRETAQIGVLEGLGWRITRVWTMDWWDNPQRELDRLLALLKTPQEAAPAKKAALPELPQLKLSGNIKPQAGPPVYRFAKLPQQTVSPEDLLSSRYTPGIRKRIISLMETEAPISKANMLRRIVQSYAIARSGSRITAHLESLLDAMGLKTTQQADQTFYWRADQDPETYQRFRTAETEETRREAKDIPVEEAAAAACQALADQLSLNGDDLVREGAKLLGYPRTGSAISALMQEAIRYAQWKGRVTLAPNGNYTLTK